jgi:TetR/AcrR family transcriptional regulator, ethionamide resistance regulator
MAAAMEAARSRQAGAPHALGSRQAKRRERTAEVRQLVCRAMLELLDEASFSELTVDEIMRRAGVSRSSFYLYFRDKQEVLMLATEELAERFYAEADRWWRGEGGGPHLVRDALAGVVAVYRGNALLLAAVNEAATYDSEVADFWRALIDRFVAATAEHLEREARAGRMPVVDPLPMSDALVWMVERSCYVHLIRGERSERELVDSLAGVWVAALYRSGPEDSLRR